MHSKHLEVASAFALTLANEAGRVSATVVAMARATVAIIGAGTWGISLAVAAARTAGVTLLYSRKPRKAELPRGVTQVESMRDLAERARLIVLAVPSSVARAVAHDLGDVIDGRHLVVHGVRGLAGDAMDSISEIVRQETPTRRVGALGGPVLTDELTAGKPSVMVCGSPFPEVNAAVIEAFASTRLRIVATSDLRGLEWTSALVGCLAILVGYAQEAGLGPGILAAIVTRAVAEAARIVEASGGEPATMLGLAGNGDLLASIAQQERPETLLGRALARGLPLEAAVQEAKLRVEAIELIPRILLWAEARKVHVPVLAALAKGLFGAPNVEGIVQEILLAPMESA